RSEANKLAKGLLESGTAKRVEIAPEESPVFEDIKLDFDWSFSDDIYRFSTKLAAAVAVASGYQSWFRKFRQGFKWRLCSPAA
ncbi:MAG TPA: hypothetical protein VIK21_04330, partial [Desulfuromonadaceae bacterium]